MIYGIFHIYQRPRGIPHILSSILTNIWIPHVSLALNLQPIMIHWTQAVGGWVVFFHTPLRSPRTHRFVSAGLPGIICFTRKLLLLPLQIRPRPPAQKRLPLPAGLHASMTLPCTFGLLSKLSMPGSRGHSLAQRRLSYGIYTKPAETIVGDFATRLNSSLHGGPCSFMSCGSCRQHFYGYSSFTFGTTIVLLLAKPCGSCSFLPRGKEIGRMSAGLLGKKSSGLRGLAQAATHPSPTTSLLMMSKAEVGTSCPKTC